MSEGKGGREEGRKGGREGGRKRGREERKKEGREAGLWVVDHSMQYQMSYTTCMM